MTDALPRNVELAYAVRRARTTAALLHVGAHPDDEDAGMLALSSRGLGLRTVYWSATRGEGAQNFVGPERGELLGIVRTWESLSARAYDGAEVRYGPFVDVGFARTGEAALATWGREAVVREIVRVIRDVQPAIVVHRWSGQDQDGHGHHRGVGLVAAEACDAAGDPGRFPELGLPPWRPRKRYHSLGGDWQPGEDVTHGAVDAAHEAAGHLRVDTGTLDPISGDTFQMLAWRGYNSHRSQGMGFVPVRREYCHYYALDATDVPPDGRERSFLAGLDPTLAGLVAWPGLPGRHVEPQLQAADRATATATAAFRPDDPTPAGAPLLEAVVALDRALQALAGHETDGARALRRLVGRKRDELERVAAQCLGLALEVDVDRRLVTPGERLELEVRLRSEAGVHAVPVDVAVAAPRGWSVDGVAELAATDARTWTTRGTVRVAADAPFDTPYWLRSARRGAAYAWDDEAAGLATDPPALVVHVEVDVAGGRARLRAPALCREAFGGGHRALPPAVVPPWSTLPARPRVVVPVDLPPTRLALRLDVRPGPGTPPDATLESVVPPGWRADPARVALSVRSPTPPTVEVDVTPPPDLEPGVHRVEHRVRVGDRVDSVAVTTVREPSPGQPPTTIERTAAREATVVRPAVVDVHAVDVAFVRRLRHAHVPGVGDDLPRVMDECGLDLTVLDDAALASADLAAYDTIVVGPNAYLGRDAVRRRAGDLLDYVRGGGTLVVLYQGYGFDTLDAAPHPVRHHQPHHRVTDERAPVRVLVPDHSVFGVPNRIVDADWEGWVADRGMYFLGDFDDAYRPLLACHDPDEPPRRGGLLVTDVGRGTWVYCGYSLWKQLPAAVPGAFRLFANLLAIPHARLLRRAELLARTTLFGPMSADDRYRVARLLTEERVEGGTVLARQGELGEQMHLVLEGEVEVVKTTTARPEGEVIAVARPGDAIGELAVLAEQPRSATLRARDRLRLLTIDGAQFRALLRDTPELADQVIATLVQKLSTTGEGP